MSKRIAFLTASEGVEEVELTEPWKAAVDAGHTAELLSVEEGEVQLFQHLDKSTTQQVDRRVSDASVGDYDALVEADRVKGKRVASWPSLQTDIRNGGGEWVDEEVVVDGNLITSRNPDDIPAFSQALLDALDG